MVGNFCSQLFEEQIGRALGLGRCFIDRYVEAQQASWTTRETVACRQSRWFQARFLRCSRAEAV